MLILLKSILSSKEYMWMLYFLKKIAVAITNFKKQTFTFSNPAPEASPVLTLGKDSKGQERTMLLLAVEGPGGVWYTCPDPAQLSSSCKPQPWQGLGWGSSPSCG